MASEIVIRQAQVKKKFPRVTRPTETAPVVLRHPTVVARSQDVVLAGLAGVPRQAAAAPANVVHVSPEALALVAAVLGRSVAEAAAVNLARPWPLQLVASENSHRLPLKPLTQLQTPCSVTSPLPLQLSALVYWQ